MPDVYADERQALDSGRVSTNTSGVERWVRHLVVVFGLLLVVLSGRGANAQVMDTVVPVTTAGGEGDAENAPPRESGMDDADALEEDSGDSVEVVNSAGGRCMEPSHVPDGREQFRARVHPAPPMVHIFIKTPPPRA